MRNNDDTDFWLSNAERGIIENKPHFVLASSNRLRKNFNRPDLAEKVLRDGLEVFTDNVQMFRELMTVIIDRDPREGLDFAQEHVARFGNHARFQKAVALGKLGRVREGLIELEQILSEEPQSAGDRFFVSQLLSMYNQEGLFEDAIGFLEPLIEDGTFTDVRMRQWLSTFLVKARRYPHKVLALLEADVDPRSMDLKKQAKEIVIVDDLSKEKASGTTNVFIVYGHSITVLNQLELLLHRIGAKPVHFRNLPHSGSLTNIEILEQVIPEAEAVIVLLLPEDEGRKRDTDQPLKPRPRQNVLIEAGYAVISKRNRSILITLGVEEEFVPSDFAGINRINAPTWSREVEIEIAKRLSHMGLTVNIGNA
jgi:predicted nucleotide-binding protein